jgi:hypothetical protein
MEARISVDVSIDGTASDIATLAKDMAELAVGTAGEADRLARDLSRELGKVPPETPSDRS